MAETLSTMLPLGTLAPDFNLPDTQGRAVDSRDFKGFRALLVMFICNHCPYVLHVRSELARIGRDYQPRGVVVVAINSNDAKRYPSDSPAKMADEAKRAGFGFPYLHDESQASAKAYRAACTPDFFVFDSSRALVYRGQLDGSRPGNSIPVTGSDVRAALENLLAGKAVSQDQVPSMGCSIKWKPGNEPGR